MNDYEEWSKAVEALYGEKLLAIKTDSHWTGKSGNEARFEYVTLLFESQQIAMSVDSATDDIIAEFKKSANTIESIGEENSLLSTYIGKSLGYVWYGKSYVGSSDMLIFSFDATTPQLIFYGICSELVVYELKSLQK